MQTPKLPKGHRMEHDFYSSDDLIDRLCHAANTEGAPIVFLVGSALCVPDQPGGHGVPGVAGMIDLIRDEFANSNSAAEFENALSSGGPNTYQNAFRFLHARKGQDAANHIVRAAVWSALDINNWPSELSPSLSARDADKAACTILERSASAWYLPAAASDFGQLLVDCFDSFGRTVLTTNFDPLIAVSISRHGGRNYRTVLHSDGTVGQTTAEGTHIVHLHGYWHGADTLHTRQQLTLQRSQLSQSLTHILEGSTLVVVGYGGWDDVVTSALVQIVSDPQSNTEILWAFHDRNRGNIGNSKGSLLDALEPGIVRGRVYLFAGIDCSVLFSAVHRRLEANYSTPSLQDRNKAQARVTEQYHADGPTRGVRVQIDIPLPVQPDASPDRPLFAETWVGRKHELALLANTDSPVAFVTGIGGQGKSVLAGELLRQQAMIPSGCFEYWDWRDCREESDRLRTQILRLIERLTDGAIDASQIESADIRATVRILFHTLAKKKALLVFDNVDQYVDLETFELVKDLDILVSQAQSQNHRSLLLFTCRPDVRIDESRALTISLDGLERHEVEELVQARRIRATGGVITALHRMTDGHPLWVNLILMQARGTSKGLQRELEAVGSGGATLPDTTRRIWQTLTDQQRTILRTMAELDRPETEANIFGLIPGVNFNRINRGLNTLRSYHLIERRTQETGEPLLSLHPIIREYVRTNFPKKDRERYVGTILEFLDRMISRFAGVLSETPTYQIMDHWIRKAEIHITFERFEEATSTIADVGPSLVKRGYSEDLIRLSVRLFERINWAEACSSFKDFDEVFSISVRAMIQAGHPDSYTYLSHFESAIPGKSSQYILLCELRCYADWYQGNYDSAIAWGEKGENLRDSTSVDTRYSTRHNLSLARRDAGEVEGALEGFLGDEALDAVISGSGPEHKEAHFFGNIGRCLFYLNRLDEALVCYIKSAKILETKAEPDSRLNKGYIRLWFGELLEARFEPEMAAVMYRAAHSMWHDSSPPRADGAYSKLMALASARPSLDTYMDEQEGRVEALYSEWLSRQ